eukprot:Gregarina_sp_Pseudo_9__2442@NODE_272_length_3326_cov_35_168239_g255_i0_p1_GENE_NODE_272_length_3326_cov_35_168239_g255_i0NODE_272_length_3326_cov_35_168239_g255_i0_p1_ORF_typecomplete_len640_score98_11Allantoicase/PF03561_15/3_6e31Allantoicase/PF03561_15/4_8e11_NODE_272_length_3326_cov_35_168239_g255_i012813200
MGAKRARVESPVVPALAAPRECDADDIDTPRFGQEDRYKQAATKGATTNGILKRIGLALLGGGSKAAEESITDSEDDSAFTTSPECDQENINCTNSATSTESKVDTEENLVQVNPLHLPVADLDDSTGIPSFCFLPDFASSMLGGKVIFATDEFYGKAENILHSSSEGETCRSTPFGEVYDAWMPRRRRTPGHEFCIIELGETAHLRGFDVDTGSLQEACPRVSIEGGSFLELVKDLRNYLEEKQSRHLDPNVLSQTDEADSDPKNVSLAVKSTFMNQPLPHTFYRDMEAFLDKKEWFEILPAHRLTEGHNWFAVSPCKDEDRRVSHVRLNLFPDGGIVRFRAYGETQVAQPFLRLLEAEAPEHSLNFLSPKLGAWPLWASTNKTPVLSNVLAPASPKSFADGWKSSRLHVRPPAIYSCPQEELPSFSDDETIVFKMASRGSPKVLYFDTAFHVGDAPFAVTVEVVDCPHVLKVPLLQQIEFFKLVGGDNLKWTPLIQRMVVTPHCMHKIVFSSHKGGRVPRSPKPEAIIEVVQDCPSSQMITDSDLEYAARTERVCLEEAAIFTHLRVKLIPDGGFSRISMYCNQVSDIEMLAGRHTTSSESLFVGPMSAKRRTTNSSRRRSTSLLFNSLQQQHKQVA